MRTPCMYLQQDSFVAVVTPHAQDRDCERSFGGFNTFPFCAVYAKAKMNDRNQFVRHNGFQIFVNKKWNSARNRFELELISTTPDNWHRPGDTCIYEY